MVIRFNIITLEIADNNKDNNNIV